MPINATFAEKALRFYQDLQWRGRLPAGISVMNPYRDATVQSYVASFLNKFYADTNTRVLVFGINPGRFGSGATGISFTDPVALEQFCGIANDLPKKRELSSVLVYQFIEAWGGPTKFYRDFFMTAVSPLGFLKGNVNYNYYDDPKLQRAAEPFIVSSLQKQLTLGVDWEAAIVFGTGKNAKFFEALNAEHGFFENVYALEHPRFIMQYRRKRIDDYIRKYQEVFAKALG